jgi:hypothetical protein
MNEPLNALEYYNLVRGRIEHEDNLMAQRLSWLVASQSFLFTAYAIALNGLAVPPLPSSVQPVVNQQMDVYSLVPVVGILTCVLIYVSIIGAFKAMRELRHGYRSRFGKDEADLPAIQTNCVTRAMGAAAPMALPLVFIAVWLFLLIHGLR